jgi:hypothetical protein
VDACTHRNVHSCANSHAGAYCDADSAGPLSPRVADMLGLTGELPAPMPRAVTRTVFTEL